VLALPFFARQRFCKLQLNHFLSLQAAPIELAATSSYLAKNAGKEMKPVTIP
jgi:hypothetical protein